MTGVRTDGFTGLVEFAPSFRPRPEIRHVLFDFDGTLSLVREGWPQVMVPLFAEILPPLCLARRSRTVVASRSEDIMGLNGKQTIYQMIRLAERVKERGGQPQDPLDYKREYLRRLNLRIAERVEGLRTGRVEPDHWLVLGSRRLLDLLRARGMMLYLASGTDEELRQTRGRPAEG